MEPLSLKVLGSTQRISLESLYIFQTSFPAVSGATDLSAKTTINMPFYPRDLNVILNENNPSDYLNISVVDINSNPIKLLGQNLYLSALNLEIDFAAQKSDIPEGIFRSGSILYVVLKNVSGINYTLNGSWSVWS